MPDPAKTGQHQCWPLRIAAASADNASVPWSICAAETITTLPGRGHPVRVKANFCPICTTRALAEHYDALPGVDWGRALGNARISTVCICSRAAQREYSTIGHAQVLQATALAASVLARFTYEDEMVVAPELLTDVDTLGDISHFKFPTPSAQVTYGESELESHAHPGRSGTFESRTSTSCNLW